MPQIKFTDAAVAKLEADTTTWFTDPTVKGLQLCVTPGGTKTWYLNKWDATAQKVRRVKLGQWASKGTHTRWAKDQIGKAALDVRDGKARTKAEKAADKAALGIPTFREALDQYIAHRTSDRASGKARMIDQTVNDYRLAFDKHLGRWGDVLVSELPVLEINQYLNALQVEHPHAAHRAGSIAGAVVRFVNRLCALSLPIPALLDNTKMKSRVQTGKLDMQVPWADRWAEIEAIENEHIRLAWMIRWLSGSRWRNALQTLTWRDVDLSTGVVSFARLKRDETGRSIVVADEVLRLFRRLHEIRFDDCDWVFPSRRRIDGERGHLDNALDRLALTCAGDLRHFWMTSAREVAPRHVHRWLAQQTMTDDDLQMLGHYGEPTREEQKATANAIASHILKRLRRVPTNVVEIERVTA
jgi:hypothetical protein